MVRHIVVVESPAKIKTVSKYLGKDFEVFASYGHIRDLESKNGSVDPKNDFEMKWASNKRGVTSLQSIKEAINQKDVESLYLATDPDREGEAISWHVVDALKSQKVLKKLSVKRIVFNEITKTAVQQALQNPREISQPLVDAYLARRALDYLVGFNLSPVLWRKLPGAKSAGRVQSVALRLVVEREEEIERFKTTEYWSIDGLFETQDAKKIQAKLTHFQRKKYDKFDIPTQQAADHILDFAKQQTYHVDEIESKQVKRNPTPAFITSTLQQEAARKLGFSGKRTMQIAQSLYEGIKIGSETVGLITYMRTDSVNLSNDALTNIRQFIEKTYGQKYLPKDPRYYKSKAKNAQEAHEAIRPTDCYRTPKELKNVLSDEQFKLYDLIWKRAVSCQMESAIFDQVGIDITSDNKDIVFRATGSTLVFDGFLSVYQEGQDDSEDQDSKEEQLPKVLEGDLLNLFDVHGNQHFTLPPPRFSEATLVKKLEELGIGRPSTYVSIIQVLQDRSYVTLDKRYFKPEDRGRIVVAFLKHHFKKYVEYDFTAQLEEQLDDISNGSLKWKTVMTQFWDPFTQRIKEAMTLANVDVIEEIEESLKEYLYKEGRTCPKCKVGSLKLKMFSYSVFLGCSQYPTCQYNKSLIQTEGDSSTLDQESGILFEDRVIGTDPITQQTITLKKGPYGFYFEFSLLPKQKKPKRISLPKDISVENATLDLVLELSALPMNLGEHPVYGSLVVGKGRFGPFVQWDKKYVSIPKTIDPLSITMEQAEELIQSKIKKLSTPKKKP